MANKATTSTDCVIKVEFVEPEAFYNKTLVVCRVAKVTLRTTCCILDNWRSTFLLLGLSWFHISGLTFVALFFTQFSGRLYLSSKLFNLSEESFFPQRFVAMSASCCMILSPVASSSSKPLAISWRILTSGTGVSRAWPVADDCSVSSFRSSSSRSSCA